jgi:uncharacterized membrane protein YoaK (UPF0700 family)
MKAWRLRALIRDPLRTRAKSIVALLLTFVAGYVDIVGALTVYDVFTAHMTGTTVRLGQQILQRNWDAVIVGCTVIGAFLFGSIVGRAIIEAGSRKSILHIGSVTLAMELALLAGFIPLGQTMLSRTHETSTAPACLLLAMLAIAMGLQTATLTRIGALTVHTTFVTGMLNKIAQLISHCLFYTYDLHHFSSAKDKLLAERHKAVLQARFLFAIWIVYLVGATCGAWLGLRSRVESLYVPCCVLLVVIAVEQAEPLSLEEEQDESEK